jgi:SAM-dependent methyltransferase
LPVDPPETTPVTSTENGATPTPAPVEAPRPATDDLDYLALNKAAWERWAPRYLTAGRKMWEANELRWGMWGVRETETQLLEGLVAGADIIELGCGTASTLACLARRGFQPVGVDIARPQIEAAADFAREFGLRFPLLCANAERLPYDRESFDCVISDYGASLWCNPRRWVPEASRLLRPGGRLIFITNSALLISCTPEGGGRAGERLVRDYFSRYRIVFPKDGTVEFHLTHGHWVRLLRASGLVLEKLIERKPRFGAKARFDFASHEWAQRWPSEDIWVATKTA